MSDPSVSQHIKDKLKAEKESYNPFHVKKRLDEKLKFFEKLLKNQNIHAELTKSDSVQEAKKVA